MEYKDFNDYELLNYIAENNEDANNIIIKKYEPLINKIATKMLPYCKNNGLEKSDLVQEGMIGLNHAIERYHEQKDVLFYTYAKKCIERKIISVVVASNRNKNKILNESISYDDDENLLLRFIKSETPSPEEEMLNIELEEDLLQKIKEKLTDLEEQVFNLLISGFKYKEIAEILDKDGKSIDNAIQRIKVKIKNMLNED
ncbi:MAG: sigma-70 family RNA polymerase sigma factor [Bacilli bacterium]|nr:sigma-70 family RNA polymerase sigma factor [Bacilli bacterium]